MIHEAKRLMPMLTKALQEEDELDFGGDDTRAHRGRRAEDALDFGGDDDDDDAVGGRTSTLHSLHMSRSAAYSESLPTRVGGIGQSPASRDLIRQSFRSLSMKTGEWAAAAHAASITSDPSRAVRSKRIRGHTRGRMLPLAQLQGGLQAAQRRMRLQPERGEEEEEETAEPDHMPALDHGVASLVQDEEDMRTSSRFWERRVPQGDLTG